MTSENPGDWNGLENLPRSAEPPAELEDRVVDALRQRGLVRGGSSRRPPWWGLAAACLVAAAVGWIGRGVVPPLLAPEPDGEEFLLLLAEPLPLRSAPSLPEMVEEYRSWAAALAEQGKMIAAARLAPEGRMLASPAPGDVVESPERNPSAATGFFVVRAASQKEAVAMAASCPHLAYGGEIHIRPITGGSDTP